jgi:hypothetical protein
MGGYELRDMMDRLFNKIDSLDEKQDQQTERLVRLEGRMDTFEVKLSDHMVNESKLTKKAATIIVSVIAVVGAVGFGSIIVFAPDVIQIAAKLVGG